MIKFLWKFFGYRILITIYVIYISISMYGKLGTPMPVGDYDYWLFLNAFCFAFLSIEMYKLWVKEASTLKVIIQRG